jgi:uncharacterized ferritin-like protein (DUF455 family)
MSCASMPPSPKDFRSAVLGPLLAQNAIQKAELTLALQADLPLNCQVVIADPGGIPGRPLNPELVSHTSLKAKPLNTTEGRALLLHAIAHIELNAIDLALDVVWRFDSMPEDFYRDWVRIAKEEAKHFLLIQKHLISMGFDYGCFPAHNSLWDMAERTKGDLLARIGLVPRTMEARGLDASPGVKNKLVSAGDLAAGRIMDIILEEEIGHVAAGNRWYRHVCQERGLDPIATYRELIQQYDAPKLKSPYNLEARRMAGFDDEELQYLAANGL